MDTVNFDNYKSVGMVDIEFEKLISIKFLAYFSDAIIDVVVTIARKRRLYRRKLSW